MRLTSKPDLKATKRVRDVREELHGDVAAVDLEVNNVIATKWRDGMRGEWASIDLQAVNWALIISLLNKTIKVNIVHIAHHSRAFQVGDRDRLSLSAFLGTKDIGVHIVHISLEIITYTLE